RPARAKAGWSLAAPCPAPCAAKGAAIAGCWRPSMSSRDATPRLRRSLLFVPGDDLHKIEKSIGAGADSLIFDLEDAVVPAHKAAARERVRDALRTLDTRGAEKLVRINPLETGLSLDDLTVTMAGNPDGYMIPKVRSEDDIRF